MFSYLNLGQDWVKVSSSNSDLIKMEISYMDTHEINVQNNKNSVSTYKQCFQIHSYPKIGIHYILPSVLKFLLYLILKGYKKSLIFTPSLKYQKDL